MNRRHLHVLAGVSSLFVLCAAHVSGATFADLAVFAAKGYFKNYVKHDASLEECVIFLNKKGVEFSFFSLVDSSQVVSQEDVARVVGQSVLVFSGDAEYVDGVIKKPLGMETWVDYCLLNDIDSGLIWTKFMERTAEGSLPEVKAFFKK